MIIYVWPNGNWLYEWEMKGFTMEHQTIPTGGRWVDLDRLWDFRDLNAWEVEAVEAALGE